MFIRLIAIIAVFISTQLYAEINFDQYGYYGQVIYHGNGNAQGYVINRYNNRKNLARKEYYNAQGYINRYISYQYNESERLASEITYSRNHNIIKKISYRYKNNVLKMKTVASNSRKYYIFYDYAYFNHKPLYVTESYYKLDIHDNESYYLKKKKAYSYKGNQQVVKNYVHYPGARQSNFQLTSTEIFKFSGDRKIWQVQSYSPNGSLKTSIEFAYKNSFNTGLENLKRINYYNINNDYYLSGEKRKSKKTLIKSIIFEYNSQPFENLKGFEGGGLSNEKNTVLTYHDPKKEDSNTTTTEKTDPAVKTVDDVDDTIQFLESEVQRFKDLKKEMQKK